MGKRDEQLMEVRDRHMVIDFLHDTKIEGRRSAYARERIALRYYLSEGYCYKVINEFQSKNSFTAAMDLFSHWVEVQVCDIFHIFVQQGPEHWEAAVVAGGTLMWLDDTQSDQESGIVAANKWIEKQLEMLRSRMAIQTELFPT